MFEIVKKGTIQQQKAVFLENFMGISVKFQR
jgi:hypothetical protein